MKILSNKKYKKLTLQLKKSESDLQKQQDKADTIQIELNNTIIELEQCKHKLMKKETELEQQREFISALNGRVVAAEVSSEKSLQRILELESKLCRKGTGTKGSKKVDNICSCNTETIDPNDDLASTEPRYVEPISEEEVRKYHGKKFKCKLRTLSYTDDIIGEIYVSKNATDLVFNHETLGIDLCGILNTEYKKGFLITDRFLWQNILNLKIFL